MKGIWNWLQMAIAAIGGFLGWLMGGWDGFLYALVVFVTIDYISGVLAAIVERKLSNEVGFKGIAKKVFVFMLVAVGHIIDKCIIGEESIIRTAIVFFYCSEEGISIIENAARIGLPIPQKLKNILEQLKSKGSGEQRA